MTTPRHILVVGNGAVHPALGPAIDAADLVIRFNNCGSAGAGGTRTDVVAVCNTGRPGRAMSRSPEWRALPPVQAAAEIWCVRDPRRFAALKPELDRARPDLADFCDDYTDDFVAVAAADGKRCRVIPGRVHDSLDNALAAHDPGSYVVPSSGLVVIHYLLSDSAFASDRITIAGFGHQGWEDHPFAAERRLVDGLAAAGRLTRLQHVSALSPV